MYCLRVKAGDFKDRPVPDVLISQVHKKGGIIECQTLTLRKLNKRIADSAADALFQTQRIVNDLLEAIRLQVPNLFRVCESVALLDMMLAFAQLSTVKDYVRPVITDTLALKTARHPLLDSVRRLQPFSLLSPRNSGLLGCFTNKIETRSCLCPERLLRNPRTPVPDRHWAKHERQDDIHPRHCFTPDHGPDWLLRPSRVCGISGYSQHFCEGDDG
jgi:hypothetical protein